MCICILPLFWSYGALKFTIFVQYWNMGAVSTLISWTDGAMVIHYLFSSDDTQFICDTPLEFGALALWKRQFGKCSHPHLLNEEDSGDGTCTKYMYVLSRYPHLWWNHRYVVTPPTHSEVWNFEVDYNYFDPAQIPPKIFSAIFFCWGCVAAPQVHSNGLPGERSKFLEVKSWYCNQSVHANPIANS